MEAGLEELTLPVDFNWIGPAAFERCNRLRTVDISRTEINEILGGTFAHCTQLQQLKLAKTVRRIHQDKCISLGEIHTPPALLYIGDCTVPPSDDIIDLVCPLSFRGCTKVAAQGFFLSSFSLEMYPLLKCTRSRDTCGGTELVLSFQSLCRLHKTIQAG